MKRHILISLMALCAAATASAQNPISYYMEGVTERTQLNPALAPRRGYFNIPVLGGIRVGTHGNISLDKIFYPVEGELLTLLSDAVPASTVLNGLDSRNLLGLDTRINLLGFGAYTRNGKNFWSFDLSLRTQVETSLPYELFDFLKRGQSTLIEDIDVSTEAYLEAAFSYSFPISDRFYLGVRAKALIGAARAQMNIERFDVSLGEDAWTAAATGRVDVTAADLTFENRTDEMGNETFMLKDNDYSFSGPAGYGFAVDLGATYDVLPNLQLSVAVNDLGFISWNESKTQSGEIGRDLRFDGVTVDAQGSSSAKFDLGDLEFDRVAPKGGARMLRAQLNAGGEYKLWKRRIGIGLLYNVRFWEYETMHNLTASVTLTPVRWFTLAASYSFIDNSAQALGLALNFNPGWLNLYVATDILTSKHTPQFIPIKQSAMNFTLGLGFPLGKYSQR